ncbi:MAG: AzlC family ABC transporter permease [Acidimicrobiales bacterium]|nr:AzlC family ABC transporter permease [Acidimicrobiales bacterium]
MDTAATPDRRAAMAAGVRRIFPLSLIAGPFGLAYGATATANEIGDVDGILASFVILAGAAQIALVDLNGDGAAWYIAVSTAIVINLRFVLYSASLAPSFREFEPRWRFGLTYLLTDQTSVLAIQEFEAHRDPAYRRWFVLGAGVWFTIPWFIGTTVGVLAGGDIPDWVQIGFVVPLMFMALLVPALTSRPKLAAAIVGATVAAAAQPLPDGVNIMLGAAAGIGVGTVLAERADG